MARVFRGVRESDGATVAVKVLKLDLAGDETYRRRFLHEARGAASVRHPNLLSIVDAGADDGVHYLALEYVPARTLSDRIGAEGPLPIANVVRLADEVSSALDALHDADLVHRDVKASNILLRDDGTAVLGDFGLVRGPGYTALTVPGQLLGTLAYVAPELIRGDPASPASDVYALGCTVYEALAGATPFASYGAFRVGLAHLDEQPADPSAARSDCPPPFGRAVLLALAKNPDLRPLPATGYARALRAAAGL
jgi:serine/threonine protein kinase